MNPIKRRKRKTILLTILGLLLAGGLVFLALLPAWSPGRPQSLLDEKGRKLSGSISEKIHVRINGTEQGMFIKSKNSANPVLLFVHDGPGMPEYWLTHQYPTGLEDHFTVVWWEQRGAALSFDPEIAPESMIAEQLVADTLEVTRGLLSRFGQEKIYLMGHSRGSYIGIQAAAQAPELYHAYIGMGQDSRQIQTEQLVGRTREMKLVVRGIFLQSWRFREYTLEEKVNLWQGEVSSCSDNFNLLDTMMASDMPRKAGRMTIPVYFFHGIYDYTCSYSLARDYFDSLEAPLKGFYTFENSAHSPLFEEPDIALSILLNDILNLKTSLADRNRPGGV